MVEIRRHDLHLLEVEMRLQAFEEYYGVPTDRCEDAFDDVEDEDLNEWRWLRKARLLITAGEETG